MPVYDPNGNVISHASAVSTKKNLILQYKSDLLTKVLGVQGNAQCGVYAIAAGWMILEKKSRVTGRPASHDAVHRKYNPKAFATCYWSDDGLTSHMASSIKARYKAILSELNAGRPTVIAVQGSTTNHYVLVFGAKAGTTVDNASPSKFYIYDPASGKTGWFGSTWAKGFNKSGYGLQYCTYNTKLKASTGGAVLSTTGGVGSSGHSRSWYIKKYGNGAEVYFLLKDAKYTHKACCAVLGNMEQESGIRVKTGGSFDGNGSEGLCQWTFGRKTTMQAYAKKHSKSGKWDSVDGQVAYLIYELKHSEKAANIVLKDSKQTLHQMTENFGRKFERPSEQYANWAARNKYADKWNTRMKGAGKATDVAQEEEVQSVGIDMKKRAEQLASSQNYAYLGVLETEEEKQKREQQNQLINTYAKQLSQGRELESGAVPEQIVTLAGLDLSANTKPKLVHTPANFQLSDALVQAPFVEATFKDYTIGSYKGQLDPAPNYISQLNVRKINGEINQYDLQIVYQIRPGEDPNKLDKLFSQVKYGKIQLRYGDSASGAIYNDTEAIVTNITQNRDYAGARITYTVKATSACNYVTSVKLDFPAVTDKPSNVMKNLLYSNGETSQMLLDAFPGMADKANIGKYIPSNDAVVNIPAKTGLSTIQYMNYLTSIMSNESNSKDAVIRNSTYYLSYSDNLSGSTFKISEVKKVDRKAVPTANVFDVTINYPTDTDVYSFEVKTDNAWSLLYENSKPSSEYVYGINAEGEQERTYSPNFFDSSQTMNEVQKNWWTQMTEFPISAQLTIRGLLTPINLMDYINIDVRFYGAKHLTSGLYVITEQQDVMTGAGFTTNLGLLRVGDSSTPSVPFSREQSVHIRKPNEVELQMASISEVAPPLEELVAGNFDFANAISKVGSNIQQPYVRTATGTSTTEYVDKESTKDESQTTGLVQYQFSKIGKTLKLSYDGATYKSGNTKVATVASNGLVTAKGGGSTTITVKRPGKNDKTITVIVPKEVSRQTALKPWYEAMEAQQKWSWNARYAWTTPTIKNSKHQGTCITMPSVAAIRCGLIPSPGFIAGEDGKTSSKSLYNRSVQYMNKINKNYWTYSWHPGGIVKDWVKKGKILPGDICDSSKHTFVYAGKKNGELRFSESGHAGSHMRGNGPGANRTSLWQKNSGDANAKLTALFRINIFDVNTTCKNGTITASRPWMAGQTVKISYKPKAGYKLKSITVDGKEVSKSKYGSSYTFKKIDKKHSVKVIYE